MIRMTGSPAMCLSVRASPINICVKEVSKSAVVGCASLGQGSLRRERWSNCAGWDKMVPKRTAVIARSSGVSGNIMSGFGIGSKTVKTTAVVVWTLVVGKQTTG